MGYLEDFKQLLETAQYPRFLKLWEEYCLGEAAEGEELIQILEVIKSSPYAHSFGQYAESILTLWETIKDPTHADEILRYVIDLQTANSPLLADLATEFLTKHYGEQKHFSDKMRIVGLRGRHNFQGAIRNYELLSHMDKGKFVFHSGGWGVGEVMEISLLREHVALEFEGIASVKDISFENAFKNLTPLPSDHFLARRFGDPDSLESEGKEDPLGLIHLLLRDVGPRSTAEIKDELYELVIPADDWAKWWQGTRSKLKKDTKVRPPKNTRDRFVLREEALSHEDQFRNALEEVKDTPALVQTIYSYSRDFPEMLKNFEFKDQLKGRLLEANEQLNEEDVAEKIEISLLLEDIFPDEYPGRVAELIKPLEQIESIINKITVAALKKRTLTIVRSTRSDWQTIFLHLLFVVPQNTLRDYLLRELQADASAKTLLREKFDDLLHKVSVYPDAFFWYFQKLVANEDVPHQGLEDQRIFLEALFILLHYVEQFAEYRDLVKKIHNLVTAKRYVMFRDLIEGASRDYLEELLLLTSKCHSLSKHDRKILQSLAQVVQPSLGTKEEKVEPEIIWATQEGYEKIQERLHHIGTVETVDNAKEIEAARALGDLRENAEYKFALERRSRLQGEMKSLTQQLDKARILTKDDIVTNEVSVGTVVDVLDGSGQAQTYTLLGPWEADPERNILSFQSKLAQAMIGCKEGDDFEFHGTTYTVKGIQSYLEAGQPHG